MSSNATSSPVDPSTRFCLIRAPVLDDSWWKRTVFGDVAEDILTGTLTRPKLIAPLQIARGMMRLYSEPAVSASTECCLATGTVRHSPAHGHTNCGRVRCEAGQRWRSPPRRSRQPRGWESGRQPRL